MMKKITIIIGILIIPVCAWAAWNNDRWNNKNWGGNSWNSHQTEIIPNNDLVWSNDGGAIWTDDGGVVWEDL